VGLICRALHLATWPARTAYGVVDEGIWAVRAMAELYGYGLSLHGQEDEPYDWFALSNEDIDRVLQ
jgi:hypothetical protein